jgi:hypothetical protein
VKRVTYLSVAEAELAEAAEYYDQQQSGLGRDFLDAVRRTEVRIQQNPELWVFHEKPLRGLRVQPFSYKLLYRELPDRIQIVAVMHFGRRPGYWKNRI